MPACPHCGCIDVHKMNGNNGERNKHFLWRCHGCKKQFTVRIGTVFEDSSIHFRIYSNNTPGYGTKAALVYDFHLNGCCHNDLL